MYTTYFPIDFMNMEIKEQSKEQNKKKVLIRLFFFFVVIFDLDWSLYNEWS